MDVSLLLINWECTIGKRVLLNSLEYLSEALDNTFPSVAVACNDPCRGKALVGFDEMNSGMHLEKGLQIMVCNLFDGRDKSGFL